MIWFLLSCATNLPEQDSGACLSLPTYEDWAQGFFKGKCQSCHASTTPNRHGAPENVIFDTYPDIEPWISAIEQSVLVQETMPPSGGVTEEERILLSQWLACPH